MSEAMDPSNVRVLVHSGALFTGATKGYGLIFTGDRVIGCKDFTEQHVVASAPLDAEAVKTLQRLLKHQQFELPFAEVQEVVVKAPGKWKPGSFTFRSTGGDQIVKIGGTFGSKFTGVSMMLDLVRDLLQSSIPGRVTTG